MHQYSPISITLQSYIWMVVTVKHNQLSLTALQTQGQLQNIHTRERERDEWMNEWMTSVFARSEALPATLTSPAQSSGIWGSGCVPTAMASHIRRLDLQLLFFKKSGFENGAKFWIHWGWSWKSDKTSVMGIEPPTVPQNVRVERIQFKPQTFAKMAKIALMLGSGKINMYTVCFVLSSMPSSETEGHFTVLWGEWSRNCSLCVRIYNCVCCHFIQ